ncbi:MAG TPA: RNA polymerase sigma factor, partial [Thermoleophilaceae bacterium]|nr:RNA polymerase sigma factor [Thermoleophilaceae bacterium]
MSDERLVEQLRGGNEAAFEVVFDRHHRGILGFCRHMLRSQEEAEDAVQQTFISAYDDLVTSDKPIRLKAWLYTIARNRCLSMLRSRREQAELPDELPTSGLTDAVVERDDLRRLLADVHNLPEDQRAALVLSELGDLSHAEIAGVVGCEPVKVKALVFQARSSLTESRKAREISCQEIREELATARGGALRRGPLRRHVRTCEGCAEFRDQVAAQRKMLALALPVIPTLGLKNAVLASVGGGH